MVLPLSPLGKGRDRGSGCPAPAGGGRQGEGPFRGFARKTGIEKGLLVQAGIKQVKYSKDSVVVDFYWERFIDGKNPASQPENDVAPTPSETPPSGLRPDLNREFVSDKMVSSLKSIRTLPISFPNQSHDYWREFYQSKGRTVTV